jgi:hypothetical protein
MAAVVVAGAQRRQSFVAHQHQELDLGEILRIGRVESAGAVLDGIAAVGGKGLVGAKRDLRQRRRR